MIFSKTAVDIRNLFEQYSFVIEESPLLTQVDLAGADGDSIYANWCDEEGGGSYTIPNDSLENVLLDENSLIFKDDSGENCRVTFYDSQEVQLSTKAYTLIWQHEYGSKVCEVHVPPHVELPLGFIDGELSEEGDGNLNLIKLINEIGFDVEISFTESLFVAEGSIERKNLSQINFI